MKWPWVSRSWKQKAEDYKRQIEELECVFNDIQELSVSLDVSAFRVLQRFQTYSFWDTSPHMDEKFGIELGRLRRLRDCLQKELKRKEFERRVRQIAREECEEEAETND